MDLRYIQELLGHSSSEMPQIYNHNLSRPFSGITRKAKQNFVSPLDNLEFDETDGLGLAPEDT
jgi:hypothetical protein